MYLPRHFEEQDRDKALNLIRAFPFATLVTVFKSAPILNHLPLVVREGKDGALTLVGHMAAKNPQAQFDSDAEILAVFNGPHTYITPTWYVGREVPTWNYAVVHATGKVRWVREFKKLVALLKEMTDVFEADRPERWRFTLPDDLKNENDLTHAIVGFEIEVTSLQAKFKLSQNRSTADREGVLRGLETRTDEMSRMVLEMMR